MVLNSQPKIIMILIIFILLSLILIYFIELNFIPEEVSIKSISLFDINKPVTIKGVPEKQNLLEQGHLIFSIKQNHSTIDAIFFSLNETITTKESYFIGKISTYKNTPQLQVKKIILKN